MSALKLIIGNKNYSSWSLRPWLAMRHAEIAFEEEVVRLDFDGEGPTNNHLKVYSPAGKVPVLFHGDTHVWDSLAILEYVAELYPDRGLWPKDRATRARARTAACEMHSSFTALRAELPMNVRRAPSRVPCSEAAQADVERIVELWNACRSDYGNDGPFLFGGFSIADAMFAPVCNRLSIYDIPIDAAASAYIDAVLGMPAYLEWKDAAEAEPWIIDAEER